MLWWHSAVSTVDRQSPPLSLTPPPHRPPADGRLYCKRRRREHEQLATGPLEVRVGGCRGDSARPCLLHAVWCLTCRLLDSWTRLADSPSRVHCTQTILCLKNNQQEDMEVWASLSRDAKASIWGFNGDFKKGHVGRL